MVIVGGQVDDDVITFIVSVDGMETEVGVGLIAECKSAGCPERVDEKQTLYLATIPPASLSIT